MTAAPNRRAGFWIRAAALLLDLLIAFVPAVILATLAAVFLEERRTSEQASACVSRVLLLSLLLLYSTFEVWAAATPGKMILRLVIAAPDGSPADRWTLALRWSTKNAPLLLALLTNALPTVLGEFLTGFMNTVIAVGCLQALDEHKRTWHDEWARTAVVHRGRPDVHEAGHSLPQ